MARLSERDVKRIENMIGDWRSSKLTWQLAAIACEKELGIKTTPKTLQTRDGIKVAMKLRKAELKAPSRATRQISDIDKANDRIARLTQRVAELENAHEVLLNQFARWAFNAEAHGITEQILNQPIPKPQL